MTVVALLVATMIALAIGFVVLRRLLGDPERVVRSWNSSQIERFHAVTHSPEHLIYVQAATEPNVDHKERLIAALGRPSQNDLRTGQSPVVEDSLIEAIVRWAAGRGATEVRNAGSSETLAAACTGAADAVGLHLSIFEVLAVAELDDALRNLAQWRVNGAYYDRGDDKEHSNNLNAAVVELDARGAGQIMVRSQPKGFVGPPKFRPSMEVVDNAGLNVEIFAEGAGFRRTSHRSFEDMRRDENGTKS